MGIRHVRTLIVVALLACSAEAHEIGTTRAIATLHRDRSYAIEITPKRAYETSTSGGSFVFRIPNAYATYSLTIISDGKAPQTQWVNGDEWSKPVALASANYLKLGFTHIVPYGLDHILFVLGIFLLTRKLKPLLTQVTAFTLAHSITLGLTIYGVIAISPRIVEPVIALSIAYIAIENVITSQLKPWRVAIVFAFGLVHGMGFAGVLRELGMPRSEFLTALVTFNVGVELGQLTVIAAASVVFGWCARRVLVPASAAIAATGVFWAIQRMI